MDLSALTLTHLRYLVAIDTTRSFRAAADECHVSQPTLSTQLQKVEEIVGARLFDRSRQPVVPTEIGERVAAQARIILRETKRLGEVARPGSLGGTFRLGVIPTLASSLVPLLLPRFAKQHPRVELVLEVVQTDRLVARLQDDSLDGGLAATPLGAPMVFERPVCREPLWIYLSPHHPLTKRARIRQSELADECVWLMPEGHCFRTQVLHLCKLHKRAQRPGDGASIRFESGSFETLIRLVDAGLGLTILPELVVRSLPPATRRARVRPFEGVTPVREISFVRIREHLRRAEADAIVDALLDTLPEEVVVHDGKAPRKQRIVAPISAA
ncbi:MAG: LysR family transcriptional regulator, hydrogen peroxide-inducible s activator [Myxococcales bacterium]|nr:LysR family transcriptional regulator, hydrogen peroxide-inducible s activator [Myxococcales bacterium]